GMRGHGVGRPAPAPSDPILACLTPGEPSDLDAIAEATGLGTAKLLPRLFALELQGAVARIGGRRFVRIDRSCSGGPGNGKNTRDRRIPGEGRDDRAASERRLPSAS